MPAAFQPVTIAPQPEIAALPAPTPAAEPAGTVEIKFADGGRMRIIGAVNASMVSALIRVLATSKRRR
jgi:hypothetical protein